MVTSEGAGAGGLGASCFAAALGGAAFFAGAFGAALGAGFGRPPPDRTVAAASVPARL